MAAIALMIRRLVPLFGLWLVLSQARATDDPLASVEARVRARFPDVHQLTIAEFLAIRPASVLDVRTPAEFAVSHLDGAINAPDLDHALAALVLVRPRDLVVVYCSVGWRSSELARNLGRHGYTGVANLEGSIFAWANRGLPVYRDGRVVTDVHPFDARWGRLLDARYRTTVPRITR